MASPFPGMDPFLEPHWLDVHSVLVVGARDSLNERLPADLVASVEERIAIESEEEAGHSFGPDVRVFEPSGEGVDQVAQAQYGGAVVEAPYRLLAQVEPQVERFVRVVDVRTERLITVIEFVSPSNKRNPGLHGFRQKRAELLACGISFVEVDMNREGNWRALLRPHLCPKQASTPYRVTIRVPADPAAVYLHPIRLDSRLPAVAIPLRHGDPMVTLDLQALLDRAYATGRYDRRLDYTLPCKPPLEDPEASWADALLRQAGRRT